MTATYGNSATRYGVVAMILHWFIAAAVVALLALGMVMVRLPLGDPLKFDLYQLHKSIGLSVLVLSCARLGWRLVNPPPPLPSSLPEWEKQAARTTHAMFYLLMIGIPISGWMLVSASPWNIPTRPFGLFVLPHLPWFSTHPHKARLEETLIEVHSLAGWIFAALLVLHVAAALRHHFILRNTILLRMLPGQRSEPPAATEKEP
jgi:cytochrome b561